MLERGWTKRYGPAGGLSPMLTYRMIGVGWGLLSCMRLEEYNNNNRLHLVEVTMSISAFIAYTCISYHL